MDKIPEIHNRMLKMAQVQTLPMGDPASAADNIISIVRFLMQRVPQDQNRKFLEKLRQKIWNMNELEIASKRISSGSAIGQSLTFIKNVLMGHNPAYIREVLKHVATKL
jgi:hypothetical protein